MSVVVTWAYDGLIADHADVAFAASGILLFMLLFGLVNRLSVRWADHRDRQPVSQTLFLYFTSRRRAPAELLN